MQTSLLQFMQMQPTRNSTKELNFFTLLWDDKDINKVTASFDSYLPTYPDIKQITSSSFKFFDNGNKTNLNIFTNIGLCKNKSTSANIKPKYLGFYKSNLQKAVRRGLTDIALYTLQTIINLGFLAQNELLRRLPIIMLEDVGLHHSFSVLMWFMIASSKGYQLADKEWNYVFASVKWMCECNQYDRLLMSFTSINSVEFFEIIPKNVTVKDIKNHKPLMQSALFSLILRLRYGGMKGDMHMIRNFINYYLNNLINNNHHFYDILDNELPQLDNELPQFDSTFKKNSIILESIDQHCTPIVNYLHNHFDEFSKKDIGKSLWFGGGFFNHRGCIPSTDTIEKYLIIYKKIEKKVQEYRNNYIISFLAPN